MDFAFAVARFLCKFYSKLLICKEHSIAVFVFVCLRQVIKSIAMFTVGILVVREIANVEMDATAAQA